MVRNEELRVHVEVKAVRRRRAAVGGQPAAMIDLTGDDDPRDEQQQRQPAAMIDLTGDDDPRGAGGSASQPP